MYRYYIMEIFAYMTKWDVRFTLKEIKDTARARYGYDHNEYGW